MKQNWNQKKDKAARAMGWYLRPYRYEEVDGCWTIRATNGSVLKTDNDAVAFVLRHGMTRDFCTTGEMWETCNAAAKLAAGGSNE